MTSETNRQRTIRVGSPDKTRSRQKKNRKQSGGDLDRLSDKFIKGENHSERLRRTQLQPTNLLSPHADRGSQTHSGLPSTSRQRQVVGLRKKTKNNPTRTKGKSRLRDSALLSERQTAGSSPLLLSSLDFYPKRRVLEGCTSMSSSFHLPPLKLKKP